MSSPIDPSLPEIIRAAVSDAVLGAVTPLTSQLDELRRFVDRRIAEMGTEISLSVEMMDMNDKAVRQSLAMVRDEVSAIAHIGAGKTAANTGYELDAVVKMTEMAADRILSAAERIANRLALENGTDEERLARLKKDLASDVEEIYEACSFQDLTGQRIRKAVEHLTLVERTLNDALGKLGEPSPEPNAGLPAEPPSALQAGLNQDDIDSLFD
jgi:chemotaxis protein CheZ